MNDSKKPRLTADKDFSHIFAEVAAIPASSIGTRKQLGQKERIVMSQFVTALSAGIIATALAGAAALAPTPAAAANAPDKAAVKQATATCRAQVKEQAKFEEMSWYARHKAVKNCVKDALAHH